ncbi:anti-sigma factor family protein [Bacillus sp. AK031]
MCRKGVKPLKTCCSEEYEEYIHEYLDEEITQDHEKKLKEHLQRCEDCQQFFHEMKKSIALVQSTSHIHAPDDFTSKVMANLPREKKKVGVQRWLRHHPLVTAASLFFIFMIGSLFTSWNESEEFAFTKQPDLIVQDHTVIVPEGKVVDGNITVKNGDLKVEGKVNGDITVINGKQYLASAGSVTGDIKEIDAAFEWLWYQIKKGFKETMDWFETEPEGI